MGRKVAVAILHGIGRTVPEFAKDITSALDKRTREPCGDDIVVRSVYWAPVLQTDENMLWSRLIQGGPMDFLKLRRLLVDFVADAIAYQVTPHDRRAYDGIHGVFAATLKSLAQAAGEDAPLCIIAHSLGTIIASNYVYDMQTEPRRPMLPMSVREVMDDTPLERLETLALLYTLGSPLPLWSLRYENFGTPIRVPDPRLPQHYPTMAGEWVNFYDQDDVFGFPLKTLNAEYDRAVAADFEVNAGGLLTNWTPISHVDYWDDDDVLEPIASALVHTWRTMNE